MDGNRCPFGSVGAVIEKDGEYLALYRTSFPQGLAGIAGHIEPGETPAQALARELKEEAGITAEAFEEVLHTTLPNSCNKGYTSHEWWLYKVTAWGGEPRLMEPEKHTFVRFVSRDEIRAHAERKDMDPAWVSLFAELGVLEKGVS